MTEEPGVTPQGAKSIAGSFEHVSRTGKRYLFEMLRIRPTSSGVQGRLRVFQLDDAGVWRLLPMKLDVRSKLFGIFATCWPPETLDRVSDGEDLELQFHDLENPERHFWPGGFDKESIWSARYNYNTQRWVLRRERFIEPGEFGNFDSVL